MSFSFDFVIAGVPEIPDSIKSFGGVFKGPCRIVKCVAKSTLEGQIRNLYLFNLISISTAFVYRVREAQLKGSLIEVDAKEQVLTIGLKKEIDQVDLNHIYDEIGILDEKRKRSLKRQKTGEEEDEEKHAWLEQLNRIDKCDPSSLSKYPELMEMMEQKSDVIRLQYIQLLCVFFVKKKGNLSEEQREKIRECSSEKLKQLCALLKERPWELAFRETSEPLEPLVASQYERACVQFKLTVPRHIVLSMRIYYACLEEMHKENHTCFGWANEAKKTLNLLEYETIEPLVMEFLEKHALTWVDVEKTTFALKQEYSEAKMICQALMKLAQKSGSLELRDENVPIVPPNLTQDQKKIAEHICSHYLTVVEGLPGTGKTVLIEWVFSKIKNVLLCTLTGMMTKSLRMRMGNRQETAHTIDHLISVAIHTKTGRPWLKKFEVLVIDEFSNTSTKGLAWLLSFLPNLKRIVFVGDHEQIGSISAGDAMGDIKSVFGSFRLTEILRVQKHLEDLCNAPSLVSQKQHRQLVFKEEGPLTLVTPSSQHQSTKTILSSILAQIFTSKKCLMNHQIVVLQNDIRHRLNEECQTICRERGLISSSKKGVQIGKHVYYVGSKITFLENYNKSTKHKLKKNQFIVSDIVSNGETGVITSITAYPNNMHHIAFVDDDRPDTPKENVILKHVICSSSVGVKPFHMDLGYATTTTKVQGREFEFSIFWNNCNPAPCWTRAHAYVAMSRGKKRVWCVSSAADLYAICDRPNKPRRTVLLHLLKRCSEEWLETQLTTPFPYAPTQNQKPFVLIPRTIPCVPVPDDEEKDEEKEELEMDD
jgi:AAA domain